MLNNVFTCWTLWLCVCTAAEAAKGAAYEPASNPPPYESPEPYPRPALYPSPEPYERALLPNNKPRLAFFAVSAAEPTATKANKQIAYKTKFWLLNCLFYYLTTFIESQHNLLRTHFRQIHFSLTNEAYQEFHFCICYLLKKQIWYDLLKELERLLYQIFFGSHHENVEHQLLDIKMCNFSDLHKCDFLSYDCFLSIKSQSRHPAINHVISLLYIASIDFFRVKCKCWKARDHVFD